MHAVRRTVSDGSHRLLEEGAAEYWGGDGEIPAREFPATSWLEALETTGPNQSPPPATYYGTAGRFVAFFVATFGLPAANELLRTTSLSSRSSTLVKELERVTGQDLETIMDGYDDYPVCKQREFRDDSVACGAVRAVDWCPDGPVVIREEIDLANPAVLGPRDGFYWTYVELETTRPARLWIRPDGGTHPDASELSGAYVEVKSCAGGCGSYAERFPVPWQFVDRYELPIGHYLVKLARPIARLGTVKFELSGDDCSGE